VIARQQPADGRSTARRPRSAPSPILIFGAGVRAAAWSALRSGWAPSCGDLFADRDLAEVCPARRIDPSRYPDDFLILAGEFPPLPWIYTGALENRPDLIAAISRRHRLLGNAPDSLRAVRDPLALVEVVRASGLDAPSVAIDPSEAPRDGSWLVKPLASGGGRGIRPWIGPDSPRLPSYYQERVEGTSLAALYLAGQGESTCIGVTRQFVGRARNRFAYRGSLAPWPLRAETRDRIDRLGRAVASAFGLVGLFGIDLIEREGRVWPIEVNPRYTASAEILEWAQGRSLMAEHLRACGEPTFMPPWPGGAGLPVAAKAILFAGRECAWPEIDRDSLPELGRFPEIADIPDVGTRFRPGQPVVTVFASGGTIEGCRRALGDRLRGWRRRLVAVRPGC